MTVSVFLEFSKNFPANGLGQSLVALTRAVAPIVGGPVRKKKIILRKEKFLSEKRSNFCIFFAKKKRETKFFHKLF